MGHWLWRLIVVSSLSLARGPAGCSFLFLAVFVEFVAEGDAHCEGGWEKGEGEKNEGLWEGWGGRWSVVEGRDGLW